MSLTEQDIKDLDLAIRQAMLDPDFHKLVKDLLPVGDFTNLDIDAAILDARTRLAPED
jgi:hypothetical protein